MRKSKNVITCILAISALHISSCADCEEFNVSNVLPRQGATKIDTIYHEWGQRAHTAASKYGNKVLFNINSFPVEPEIGDSIVKRAGEAEYTLYRGDSIYVQRFDCGKGRGIILSRSVRLP